MSVEGVLGIMGEGDVVGETGTRGIVLNPGVCAEVGDGGDEIGG